MRSRAASVTGSQLALTKARQILDRAVTQPVAVGPPGSAFDGTERSAVPEHSCPAQRGEISGDRRRTRRQLDTVDVPLNNRWWLEEQFAGSRSSAGREGPPGSNRGNRELDQSRPGRVLRRSGRSVAPAAPGSRPGPIPTDPVFLRVVLSASAAAAWAAWTW